MSRPFELTIHFRSRDHIDVTAMLRELKVFTDTLAGVSPKLSGWLLKGNTKAEALLYEAFDGEGPRTAAIAVLNEALKNETDPRIVSIWNGLEGAEGASLQYVGRPPTETSLVTLRAKPQAFSQDWKAVAEAVHAAARVWSPTVASVESAGYFDHKTFKDRPGVGWMIYLPLILSVPQVPEARALVPVRDQDDKPLGTIVVSVVDGAFSETNPEHLRIAQAIETRLVDQDFLPRYESL